MALPRGEIPAGVHRGYRAGQLTRCRTQRSVFPEVMCLRGLPGDAEAGAPFRQSPESREAPRPDGCMAITWRRGRERMFQKKTASVGTLRRERSSVDQSRIWGWVLAAGEGSFLGKGPPSGILLAALLHLTGATRPLAIWLGTGGGSPYPELLQEDGGPLSLVQVRCCLAPVLRSLLQLPCELRCSGNGCWPGRVTGRLRKGEAARPGCRAGTERRKGGRGSLEAGRVPTAQEEPGGQG